MKMQRTLQNLMIILSFVLLVLYAISGVRMTSAGETNAHLLRSFMGMLALLTCIGAVVFRVSDGAKPLDWVLGGAALGTAICLCALLSVIDNDFAAGVLFWPYLLEFLLSASYKIGRHFGIFI